MDWAIVGIFVGGAAFGLLGVKLGSLLQPPAIDAHVVAQLLSHVYCQLVCFERKLDKMATKAEFDTLVGELTTELAKVSSRIAALEAQVAAGGLTAEEEAAVLGELTTLKASISAMAPA